MLQLQDLNNALDEIEVESRENSKLLKLKKALEIEYQKNLLENIDKDDLNLLKYYFTKIIDGQNLTISQITNILNEYVEESNHEPYSQIIENIKDDLHFKKISIDEFLDFIEKFVHQNYPIDIFYKKHFKRSPYSSPQKPKPSLTDIFGDELNDLSSTSEESEDEESGEVKLQKIRSKIEEKIQIPKSVEVIAPLPEKKRGRIAVINDISIPRPKIPNPKPTKHKIFFDAMDDLTKQDCEFLFKKIPWVKDIVNNIYVHPIEGDFDNVLDYSKFIEHNNLKYYYPKEKYYNVQCKAHKVQEGDQLTVIKNGQIYKMMVAVDTNTKGIVLQNEDMLKAEIEYIRVWNQNKDEHIKDLYKNKPNQDMILLAKFELSSALQDAISGNVPVIYRSSNSSFIETVVDTILKNSNSGESFVRLLANLIIFLKINLSFITSSVFIKRLREQIYLPGTLPFLTEADKLPEIFLVQNVPKKTKTFVLEKLEEERVKFTRKFFENLYIGSSLMRKPTKPILWNKPTQQIELPDLKTICKNKDEIVEENDEDIVFYTDLNEIYCFNVFKLYDLFRKEQFPINPYTGRPFSDKFIQIFLTRYASKPLSKKIERVQHVDLITKLEQLIEQELDILENNLIKIENPEFIEKFKSPQEIVNKVKDKNNQCMECKKDLGSGSEKITSIFRNKEVAFCNYDCLEKNKAFK